MKAFPRNCFSYPRCGCDYDGQCYDEAYDLNPQSMSMSVADFSPCWRPGTDGRRIAQMSKFAEGLLDCVSFQMV